MSNHKKQVNFWTGRTGNQYIERNQSSDQNKKNRLDFWKNIFSKINLNKNAKIFEVGANIGLNLSAIKLFRDDEMFAIEPNSLACEEIRKNKILDEDHLLQTTANKIGFTDNKFDLVFTCGVLIHIHPDDLLQAMKEINRVSKKYIVCAEYFSDKDEEIEYHGQSGLLFKKDFGSFYLDNFQNLKLVDYGFSWERVTGMDNLTWWIFEIN
jgi:pseudaminic acid biosynthesis-associated methylase